MQKAFESDIMSEFCKGQYNFMTNYAACCYLDKLKVISLNASGYKLNASMPLLQLNSLVKCSITHISHEIFKKIKYKGSWGQKMSIETILVHFQYVVCKDLKHL